MHLLVPPEGIGGSFVTGVYGGGAAGVLDRRWPPGRENVRGEAVDPAHRCVAVELSIFPARSQRSPRAAQHLQRC
jgi:hypothetical protein